MHHVTSGSCSSREISPSCSPGTAMNTPGLNAPRFGTTVPNRIFVGGITTDTSECDLEALFARFGSVNAVKIISDRAGVPKGYGFITFETEEEAKRVLRDGDNLILKGRKLNVAIAIKKQQVSRIESSHQYAGLGNGSLGGLPMGHLFGGSGNGLGNPFMAPPFDPHTAYYAADPSALYSPFGPSPTHHHALSQGIPGSGGAPGGTYPTLFYPHPSTHGITFIAQPPPPSVPNGLGGYGASPNHPHHHLTGGAPGGNSHSPSYGNQQQHHHQHTSPSGLGQGQPQQGNGASVGGQQPPGGQAANWAPAHYITMPQVMVNNPLNQIS